MATSTSEMAANWTQGMQGVAQAFDAGVAAAGPNALCAGLAKLGISEAACQARIGSKWYSRVQGKGSAVAAGAAGKGEKFIRNFIRGVSGG